MLTAKQVDYRFWIRTAAAAAATDSNGVFDPEGDDFPEAPGRAPSFTSSSFLHNFTNLCCITPTAVRFSPCCSPELIEYVFHSLQAHLFYRWLGMLSALPTWPDCVLFLLPRSLDGSRYWKEKKKKKKKRMQTDAVKEPKLRVSSCRLRS